MNSEPTPNKVTNLAPFPNGWYVIERSDLVKPGQLVTKRFAGKDVVVYRTDSGIISVVDAYCPHMGAHLGHGGCVKGENIQCPFHAFEFNTNGSCVKTGYDSEPPHGLEINKFVTREVNGVILIYYHLENKKPEWEIPKMEMEGWTNFLWEEWELSSHPQETTENSVDIGHFSATHGYRNVHVVTPAVFEENHMAINYGMERDGFLGKKSSSIEIEFKGDVHGLGYSIVEAVTKNYGITTRHFVLPTPIEDGKIILRIASSMKRIKKPSKVHFLASIVPPALMNYVLSRIVFKGYKNDVSQDFKIWENKKYIMKTPLATGDGPILLYRKWAQQFY